MPICLAQSIGGEAMKGLQFGVATIALLALGGYTAYELVPELLRLRVWPLLLGFIFFIAAWNWWHWMKRL